MEIYDNEFPAGKHLSTVVQTPFLQPAIDTSGQKNELTTRNTSAGEGPAYTQAFISLAIDVPTGQVAIASASVAPAANQPPLTSASVAPETSQPPPSTSQPPNTLASVAPATSKLQRPPLPPTLSRSPSPADEPSPNQVGSSMKPSSYVGHRAIFQAFSGSRGFASKRPRQFHSGRRKRKW